VNFEAVSELDRERVVRINTKVFVEDNAIIRKMLAAAFLSDGSKHVAKRKRVKMGSS
jgi:DNA-binding transcriptional regulator WhiA